MKCEYCDTSYGDEVTGTCPNCGAALPERKAASAVTVGASRDEERRKELKESGCKYCPYCLSTNVAKPGAGTRFIIVALFVLSCVLTAAIPWLIVLPIFFLLCIWLMAVTLCCGNCRTEWTPIQAKVYEKYRFQLYSTLGRQAAVQCPGINRQSVIMNIHSVKMVHMSKERIVRYDQLMRAFHRVPAGDLFGYLTVRSISNKDRPVPKSYEEAKDDLMTVIYEAEYEPYYWTMYNSLKEIAEMNTRGTKS